MLVAWGIHCCRISQIIFDMLLLEVLVLRLFICEFLRCIIASVPVGRVRPSVGPFDGPSRFRQKRSDQMAAMTQSMQTIHENAPFGLMGIWNYLGILILSRAYTRPQTRTCKRVRVKINTRADERTQAHEWTLTIPRTNGSLHVHKLVVCSHIRLDFLFSPSVSSFRSINLFC